jgi:hypothetical protein
VYSLIDNMHLMHYLWAAHKSTFYARHIDGKLWLRPFKQAYLQALDMFSFWDILYTIIVYGLIDNMHCIHWFWAAHGGASYARHINGKLWLRPFKQAYLQAPDMLSFWDILYTIIVYSLTYTLYIAFEPHMEVPPMRDISMESCD